MLRKKHWVIPQGFHHLGLAIVVPILLKMLPQQKKKKQAVCAACLLSRYISRACMTSLWTRSFSGLPA